MSFDTNIRYKTLKEFAAALLFVFSQLDGAEELAKSRHEIKKKNDPENKFKSFWVSKVPCMTFTKSSFWRDVADSWRGGLSSPKCDENATTVISKNDDVPTDEQLAKLRKLTFDRNYTFADYKLI